MPSENSRAPLHRPNGMTGFRSSSWRKVIATAVLWLSFVGCAAQRPPVPLGTVPEPPITRSVDERYGQQALAELTRQFPLSRDDSARDRVEQLVNRLAAAAGATIHDPWHVYVFDAPTIKNAAATRGNHLFVWSGLLNYVRDDEELSVVLAHELGHILAGHTMPDPGETMNKALAQSAGAITTSVVNASTRAAAGGVTGQLAGALAELALQALIVSPNERQLENEADEIGLFLMARAGLNPEVALQFWDRVQTDPDFGAGAGGLAFLSSHPTNKERFERLRTILPLAQAGRLSAFKLVNQSYGKSAPIYEYPAANAPVIGTLTSTGYFFADCGESLDCKSRGWVCNPHGRGCMQARDIRGIP